MFGFVARSLEVNGKCSGCGKPIHKHKEIVVRFRTQHSKGQHVNICKACIDNMYNSMKEGKC